MAMLRVVSGYALRANPTYAQLNGKPQVGLAPRA